MTPTEMRKRGCILKNNLINLKATNFFTLINCCYPLSGRVSEGAGGAKIKTSLFSF